jgi:hypothetical protein
MVAALKMGDFNIAGSAHTRYVDACAARLNGIRARENTPAALVTQHTTRV